MQLLRSLLFLPGNTPGMVQNAALFDADAVIFDLEDSVSPDEKDSARILTATALQSINLAGTKSIIRINSLSGNYGTADLERIIPSCPDMIMIPKVETVKDISDCAEIVSRLLKPGQKMPGFILLIETAKGIANLSRLVEVNFPLIGLAFGAEDYTASLGCKRTKEGLEIATARALISNAGAMADISRFDTPFTDVHDNDGLNRDTQKAREMGFTGKLLIHPCQVDIVHRIFNPQPEEILWARRVLASIKAAREHGRGVASLDGKMIDMPIEIRAQHILDTAERLQLMSGD